VVARERQAAKERSRARAPAGGLDAGQIRSGVAAATDREQSANSSQSERPR